MRARTAIAGTAHGIRLTAVGWGLVTIPVSYTHLTLPTKAEV